MSRRTDFRPAAGLSRLAGILLLVGCSLPLTAHAADAPPLAVAQAAATELRVLQANSAVEGYEANLALTTALLARSALPPSDLASVLRYHIEAMAGLGRWDLFERADHESARLLEQLTEPDLVVPLWISRGRARELRGNWADAQRMYQVSLDHLPPGLPDLRSQLLAGVGRTHLVLGNYDASLAALLDAERLRREHRLPNDSSVLRGLCTFFIYGGNWDTALEADQKRAVQWCELDVAANEGRPKRRFAAIGNLAFALRLAKDYQRADALLETEYQSKAHQSDPNFGLSANYVGVLERRGDLEGALKVLADLQVLTTRLGSHQERAHTLRRRGGLLDKLGRYSEAVKAYQQAYALYVDHPDAQQQVFVLLGLLRDQIRVDEPPAVVLATFEKYLALYNEHNGAEARRRVERLQARYDLERKEHEIASAREREAATRKVVVLLLVGLLLMSVAAGLLVVNLRLRKRAGLRLAEKNTEIESLNRELRRKSQEDPLTGLNNRRSLDERVKAFMDAQGRRGTDATGPRRFVVFLLDLDHFKSINDRHGHVAGDAVLRQFAGVLQRCARQGDVQARWGGEEFCWLCPDLDFDDAEGVCLRLLRAVNDEAFDIGGQPLKVTCSIGYSTWLAEASAPGRWELATRVADLALYEAKADGRNRGVGLDGGDDLEPGLSTEALRDALASGVLRRHLVHAP